MQSYGDDTVSANGAEFIASLGQAPQEPTEQQNVSAEGATH